MTTPLIATSPISESGNFRPTPAREAWEEKLREAYEAIGTHFMAAHPVENEPGSYVVCQFCGASGNTAFDLDHYDDCLVRKANEWLSNNPNQEEENNHG